MSNSSSSSNNLLAKLLYKSRDVYQAHVWPFMSDNDAISVMHLNQRIYDFYDRYRYSLKHDVVAPSDLALSSFNNSSSRVLITGLKQFPASSIQTLASPHSPPPPLSKIEYLVDSVADVDNLTNSDRIIHLQSLTTIHFQLHIPFRPRIISSLLYLSNLTDLSIKSTVVIQLSDVLTSLSSFSKITKLSLFNVISDNANWYSQLPRGLISLVISFYRAPPRPLPKSDENSDMDWPTTLLDLSLDHKYINVLYVITVPRHIRTLRLGKDYVMKMNDLLFSDLTELCLEEDSSLSLLVPPCHLSVFPKLSKFTLNNYFAINVKTLTLPASLTYCSIGACYPSVFTSLTNLTILHFGDFFNIKIEHHVLPPRLVELSFGIHFDHPLSAVDDDGKETTVLPRSLKRLTTGQYWKHYSETCFPHELESLTMNVQKPMIYTNEISISDKIYTIPFKRLFLPNQPSFKQLSWVGKVNSGLTFDPQFYFPVNITRLYLLMETPMNNFHLIPSVTLPQGLEVCHFGPWFFDTKLERGVLPSTVTDLSFTHYNYGFDRNVLPPRLKRLDLGSTFNHSLQNHIVFHHLETLVLSDLYQQDAIDFEAITPSLFSLTIKKLYPYALLSSSLPDHLTFLHVEHGYRFLSTIPKGPWSINTFPRL